MAKIEIFRNFQIWTGFEPEKILNFDSRFDHSTIEYIFYWFALS